MTSQDWKEVEEELKSLYSLVKLKCDGYEVALALRRISQFENAILIYVNGVMKGKWIIEDCEERRRFFQPCSKSSYSQKQKESMKKISKRLRKKYDLPDPDAKYTFYRPYWKSFTALKRHLIKNNNTIEMVREQTNTA